MSKLYMMSYIKFIYYLLSNISLGSHRILTGKQSIWDLKLATHCPVYEKPGLCTQAWNYIHLSTHNQNKKWLAARELTV